MKIHRFYLKNILIDEKNNNLIVTHETEFIHQIKNVLKLKKGEVFVVFNQEVGEIEVKLFDINKKDMSFMYIRHIQNKQENNRNVNLYMSVIKNNNFDLIVEKCVELGVNKIIPIISDRSVKTNLNIDRLNRIIKEATEQCGRIDLLNLCKIEKLSGIFDSLNLKNDRILNLYGSVDRYDSENIDIYKIENILKNKEEINLFIGPEGGYSLNEINSFKSNNILPININKNTLRAETAAILGVGILSITR